ncbi:MAG: ABC transporter substrate-binding protein [Candidatus Lustribacter sp.]|jgi:NitT/TauT family transport system substrate-binding protein
MNGRLSRRSLLAAALAAPSALAAQTLTTLAIAGVPEDSITPVLYGVQSGLFRRNGLDVHVSPERSGPAITAGVVGGAYQIGKSSIAPLIEAHAKGLPIALVAPAGVYNSTAPIDGMFVAVNSPVKTAADLNGKVYGVYGIGDIYTISARAWMAKNGGDPNSLKFVELPISAMVDAIATGRVDAGSMNEPALQQALTSPRLRKLTDVFAAIAPRFLYTAWFTATDYAAAHRPAIDAFARSMRDAAAYANAHHDETVDMLAAFTAVDAATIRKMTRVEQGITLDPKQIQPVIDAMAAAKTIPAAFDARQMFLQV